MSKLLQRLQSSPTVLIIMIVTLGLCPLWVSEGGFLTASDAGEQILPFIIETKRVLASGVPFWSWNTFLGDNFIGSYIYYTLTSPFNLLNCLFPYSHMVLGFTFMLYLRMIVCGWVSYAYFRLMDFDRHYSLLGCLLFTFSSWAVVNLYYVAFIEPMIAFVVLLIFVERYLRRRRYALTGLILASGLTAVINFYFIPANFIAATIYFFVRAGYMDLRPSKVLALTCKALGCVVLGFICAAVVLVPIWLVLSGSPRSEFDMANMIDVSAMYNRLLALFVPGYTMHSLLWSLPSNVEIAACIAVFGSLPFLLLLRQWRRYWFVGLTVIYLVMFLTPLNGVFSLFTSFLYTRWVYALDLGLILCALVWLRSSTRPFSRQALVYSGAVAAVFAATIIRCWKYEPFDTISTCRLLGWITLTAINLAALIWVSYKKQRSLVAVVVCLTCQLMLGMAALAGGGDFSVFDRMAVLSAVDDAAKFDRGSKMTSRTDFEYDHTLTSNWGVVTGTPSVQTYHSVYSPSYVTLSKSMLIGHGRKNTFEHFAHRQSFDALASVDRIIRTSEYPQTRVFDTVPFRYYIPMGFAYDRYSLSHELEPMQEQLKGYKSRLKEEEVPDAPDVALGMLRSLVIDASDADSLSRYVSYVPFSTDVDIDSVVDCRRQIVCSKFEGDTGGFSAAISLDRPQVVFFSVIYDPGFSACIDGTPTKIYNVNSGFSAVVVPPGEHTIRFDYFTPGLKTGAILSIIALLLTACIFIAERRNYRHHHKFTY